MANNNVILPGFASQSKHPSANKKKAKKVLKIILRVIKILVYLTFFGIGLYGCFQTTVDPFTVPSLNPGSGFEMGFGFDEMVYDPRFDLIYSGNSGYFTISSFTMAYGPFYALFVWPFAQLLLRFMYATRDWPVGLNALFGIFLILLIIRIITFAISTSSIIHSEKLTEIQGKIAEINAKYKDAKDMASRQKKQLEISQLYKKHNIKPFAAMEQVFVTLPIFLIVYRVVTTLRPLKFVLLFGAWDLTASPVQTILSDISTGWPYIFFLLIIIPVQFLSIFIPRHFAKKRSKSAVTVGQKNKSGMKSQKITNNVITGFMVLMVAVTSAGVGVYWFFNALFSILQSYIMHKIILKRREKGVKISSTLSKLGID